MHLEFGRKWGNGSGTEYLNTRFPGSLCLPCYVRKGIIRYHELLILYVGTYVEISIDKFNKEKVSYIFFLSNIICILFVCMIIPIDMLYIV